MQVEVTLDAREVEDTGQVERIIHIQVNPEQWFFRHWIQVAIEFLIVFISHIGRFANPCRSDIVDDVIFVGIDIFTVFPFLLFTECDRNGEETAVFCQQAADLVFIQEVFVFVVDIQDNICTTVVFLCFFQRIFGSAVATPFHRNSAFFIRFGYNFHFL